MRGNSLSNFAEEVDKIARTSGVQSAYNRILRTEVSLQIRRPALAIYDHAFHFIGGAQKYGLTMTSLLQEQFDITIIANEEVSHQNFYEWYELDLSKCPIKVIKLPFYEQKNDPHLDPACITKELENPFHLVSKESGNYDFFINNSMNEMVFPLANVSVLVCHFPERRPKSYFYADKYTSVVYNSKFTAEWIEKKWKFSPHQHIYPPVDMLVKGEDLKKKKYILSVARFEIEGTKRQKEMIKLFIKLSQHYQDIAQNWKFLVVGGSNPGNPYLSELDDLIKTNSFRNIELKVNIPKEELKNLYQQSSLFWHLCGLGGKDPAETEHFGMAVVEAMQNKVVPIVFDGGGLREIVDHGQNGFCVQNSAALLEYSLKLIKNPDILRKMSQKACEKAGNFSTENFKKNVLSFFQQLLEDYIIKQ